MTSKKSSSTPKNEGGMFEAVIARLGEAAKIYGLEEDVATVVRHPQKEIKVSLPIMMVHLCVPGMMWRRWTKKW